MHQTRLLFLLLLLLLLSASQVFQMYSQSWETLNKAKTCPLGPGSHGDVNKNVETDWNGVVDTKTEARARKQTVATRQKLRPGNQELNPESPNEGE